MLPMQHASCTFPLKIGNFSTLDNLSAAFRCQNRVDILIQPKNHYPKLESIPFHLLSRQVCFLTFQTSGIDPIPLAFKASFMSSAPLVLHCTRTGSRIWTRSLMRINSSHRSKHSMFSRERKAHEFHVYPHCVYAI